MTVLSRLTIVTAGVLILVGCAGCSTPQLGEEPNVSQTSAPTSSGQTLAEARAQLQERSGLTDTSITVNETMSGFQEHRRLRLEASTTSTSEDEQRTLVEYMFALGWSVNDVDADQGVSVRVHTQPQVTIGALLKDWEGLQYRSTSDSFRELVVASRKVLERQLGQWPGAVPSR